MIRGGKEGYERLRLLARDRWPDTAALFLLQHLGQPVDLLCRMWAGVRPGASHFPALVATLKGFRTGATAHWPCRPQGQRPRFPRAKIMSWLVG